MGTDDADGALTIDGHRFWCCSAIGCDDVASILVESNPGSAEAYCGRHWDELRVPFAAAELYIPHRPTCFHSACSTPAVCIKTHLDGTRLPVCDAHLDDLSWVSPTQSELLELKLR